MTRFLLAVLLLFSLPLGAQPASPHFITDGAHLAQRLTAFALREDVVEGDARVARTRDWLARAAQATGEEEGAVAAACVRAAKFLQDSVRVRANALELLEALADATKPGQTMSDGLMAYVEARKFVPDRSHAAAMATLRGTGK